MESSRDRPPRSPILKARLRRDEGVETLEVALIGILAVIAIMLAVPPLADGVGVAIQSVATSIQGAGAPLGD